MFRRLTIAPILILFAGLGIPDQRPADANGRQVEFPAGSGQFRAAAAEPQFRIPVQRKPPLNRPPLGGQGRVLNPNQIKKQELRRRIMQAIGLRQDQRQRMQEIRKSHDDEVISAGRRLRQARAALDREIMSETYSEAAVRRATEELAQAQADKIRLDARIRSEVRGVLTPEQVGRFHIVEREIRQQMRQEQREQQEKPPEQRQQQQGGSRFDSGAEMGFEDALELDAFAGESDILDDEIDLVELLLTENN